MRSSGALERGKGFGGGQPWECPKCGSNSYTVGPLIEDRKKVGKVTTCKRCRYAVEVRG